MSKDNTGNDFSSICTRWMTRREAVKGLLAAGVTATTISTLTAACITSDTIGDDIPTPPRLSFAEIPHMLDDNHHVAAGYDAEVLLSWGDPILPGGRTFDASAQTAAAQSRQFGYNNDFLAYFPLPAGDRSPDDEDQHGLLCVNHEYTNAHLMFPGYSSWRDSAAGLDREQIDIEMAAHGLSVIEIRKQDGHWSFVKNSRFNRRITMDTPMRMSGPAAGHARLRTNADPSGTRVLGTMGNCAGGVTPWGTVLTAEENFRYNFGGHPEELAESYPKEVRNYARFRFGDHERRQWYRFHERFHIANEAHEANRFGWMVEFDPYDPQSEPVKHTGLGRCEHEGCSVVTEEGRPLVAYTGDDGIGEYIYKFVSNDSYRQDNGKRNSALFDDGILYAARFNDDGTGRWLPLIFGQGPLTPANGFADQGDVLIDCRIAADLLGATPMDRPEDIDTNPLTGRTYVMLTKNTARELTDAVNSRVNNAWGQVVEILPPGVDGQRDHVALEFGWDIFILAGEPGKGSKAGGQYGAGTSDDGWFCNPDNIAFDPFGRIWMATDSSNQFGFHDGLWAAQTTGPERAVSRHFFGCPRGGELCGPCFTPDGKTLFVAVQHPADEKGSTYLNPSTRWPDFDDALPPRPSLMAITRRDGKVIGS
ncbi:MAG: PhoX family phosphatase [Woeseia sp.]